MAAAGGARQSFAPGPPGRGGYASATVEARGVQSRAALLRPRRAVGARATAAGRSARRRDVPRRSSREENASSTSKINDALKRVDARQLGSNYLYILNRIEHTHEVQSRLLCGTSTTEFEY
mmetsp:Transcript_12802/g.25571  ORF Transcript_12802/g.25571 Transcript_12802/m.25571 type:complete len:121 (-) Transcript_12802:27-389(-)